MDRHGGDRVTDDFADVIEADAIERRVCVDGIELVVEYGECRLYITVYRLPYLPIYRSKNHQHGGIQLNLYNGWDAWTYLEKNFYVKMDEIYEIPVESLMAAGANGRQYELHSKSQDKIQGFLRKMNVRAIRDGASSTLCQLLEELIEVQLPASKSSSTMLRISRSDALENASGTSPSRSATGTVTVRPSEPRASRSRPHIRALVSITSKKPISLWY